MDRISVIVLTRNSEKHLKKCLDSIFMQTYPDYEVIVIDSFSTDRTPIILNNYPKAKIIPFAKDISVGLARKIGSDAATGEILAYIDSDVEPPHPNWLENMHKPFLEYPNIAGVQTLAKNKPSDPPILKKIHARFEYKDKIIGIDNYQPIGTSHLLIKKRILENAGGFKDVFSGEDIELMKSIMKQGYKFIYLKEEKCYHYHVDSYMAHIKRELRGLKNRIKTKLLR